MNKSVDLEFKCRICGTSCAPVVCFENLPLTDTYIPQGMAAPGVEPGYDLTLMLCEDCGHAQLKTPLSPTILYGSSYHFRTSQSANARKGTAFFLSTLEAAAPGRTFSCVLDVGCNDLYLLSQLSDRARIRVGIDPIWRGREAECSDPGIQVFGSTLEELNVLQLMPERPDLIVCRHTLEHVVDPRSVLKRLMEIAAPGALFLFEVPGFETLLETLRFDQIFHQHLHYFSRASFARLLTTVGGRILLIRDNPTDWGAMAIAYQAGTETQSWSHSWTCESVQSRYAEFQREMQRIQMHLQQLAKPVYGYGATQMLPVLSWHLGTDLSEFTAILDDDPSKEGMRYWNLPVPISTHISPGELQSASVLITAIDHASALFRRIDALGGAKVILCPFRTSDTHKERPQHDAT